MSLCPLQQEGKDLNLFFARLHMHAQHKIRYFHRGSFLFSCFTYILYDLYWYHPPYILDSDLHWCSYCTVLLTSLATLFAKTFPVPALRWQIYPIPD